MTEKHEKHDHNKAVQDLTRFLNLFPAAAELRDAFSAVPELEGEIARLKAEKKKAEAEAIEAIEARDKAKAGLETTQKRFEGVRRDFERAVQLEDEGVKKYQQQCRERTEQIRAEHEVERKHILDEILALEAKRSDLAKAVREMEQHPGEPAKGSQARVEP